MKNEGVKDGHLSDFGWWLVSEFSREASCMQVAEISFMFQEKALYPVPAPNPHIPHKWGWFIPSVKVPIMTL